MLQPEDYADVPINTEDHANVLLRFDNGNKGVITVSQVSAGSQKPDETGDCRLEEKPLPGTPKRRMKCGSETAMATTRV
jgi:hypothetical protein